MKHNQTNGQKLHSIGLKIVEKNPILKLVQVALYWAFALILNYSIT